MTKKTEYKPVMVFYMKDFEYSTDETKGGVLESLKKLKEELGYSTLVIPIEGENRVEIISVDKATIVEEIQKYIDLKIAE
jgi:hypothetical protein